MKTKYFALYYLLLMTFAVKAQVTDTVSICATDPEEYAVDNVGVLQETTWTLKVLLVEFSDVKHRNPVNHGLPAYTLQDWNNLFFSEFTYITGPDGKNAYGSMRDFYYLMSDGEFTLSGFIVNRDDNQDGIPDWITLQNTKEYYDTHSFSVFRSDAKNAAQSAGLDIATNTTTKLAIIYAGHTYRDYSGLNPRKVGNDYIMGERFALGPPYRQERSDAIFAGIGIHAHEFGHLLGWPDTGGNPWGSRGWDLMNGSPIFPITSGVPNNKAATAPAPPNPKMRYDRGWITYVEITSDVTFSADYDLKDPEVFRIKDSSDPSRYFLIENRNFEATMDFNGTQIWDYNHWLPWADFQASPTGIPNQGLLIWAHKKYNNDPSWAYIIQADGFNNVNHPHNSRDPEGTLSPYADSGDPFPGVHGVKVISP